jgi:hypothetical protein
MFGGQRSQSCLPMTMARILSSLSVTRVEDKRKQSLSLLLARSSGSPVKEDSLQEILEDLSSIKIESAGIASPAYGEGES